MYWDGGVEHEEVTGALGVAEGDGGGDGVGDDEAGDVGWDGGVGVVVVEVEGAVGDGGEVGGVEV